jgi:hypothetical protein
LSFLLREKRERRRGELQFEIHSKKNQLQIEKYVQLSFLLLRERERERERQREEEDEEEGAKESTK